MDKKPTIKDAIIQDKDKKIYNLKTARNVLIIWTISLIILLLVLSILVDREISNSFKAGQQSILNGSNYTCTLNSGTIYGTYVGSNYSKFTAGTLYTGYYKPEWKLCSDNCFLTISKYASSSVNMSDSFISDLIKRNIVSVENCERCNN